MYSESNTYGLGFRSTTGHAVDPSSVSTSTYYPKQIVYKMYIITDHKVYQPLDSLNGG